jgi:hypothetical protein
MKPTHSAPDFSPTTHFAALITPTGRQDCLKIQIAAMYIGPYMCLARVHRPFHPFPNSLCSACYWHPIYSRNMSSHQSAQRPAAAFRHPDVLGQLPQEACEPSWPSSWRLPRWHHLCMMKWDVTTDVSEGGRVRSVHLQSQPFTRARMQGAASAQDNNSQVLIRQLVRYYHRPVGRWTSAQRAPPVTALTDQIGNPRPKTN